ncbi:imm11 family protein [Pedobacter helvus]|uniref:Imm11 family protein n=1 Tax=Pedobacter helvus TaxID=2563444 RepID=A0ABW9JJ47_9SPHI|nr:DUF1629 domain-containing protein [Pedobacter ureilyticus]
MNYYRILDDFESIPDRWYLGKVSSGNEIDIWKYVGIGDVEVSHEDLWVDVKKGRTPIDFTFCDFDLLVVNEKVKELLSPEEIQFIPIKINGNLIIDSYYLAVTKKGVDCVDESKSLFDKWKEDDSVRPDKAGEYKTIYKLMIDPEKIQGEHFFRIKKYDVAIIISEKLKQKMEEKHIKGIKFKKVSL